MNDKNNEEEYDVVIDVLSKHQIHLWNMTKKNMDSNIFNIMDTLRLEQIDKIDECINLWKNHKNKKNYDAGYTGGPVSDGGMDPRNK